MPTATPEILNSVNGKIQKFRIEANDPELDEVFRRGGEITISGDVRSSPFFDGRTVEPLKGSWKVQLAGGVGAGRDITEVQISGTGRTMKISGSEEDLDNFIGKFYTQDEREQKAGDFSFDQDHANEILGSSHIVFYREIEEEEEENEPTQPSIPNGEEPERDLNPIIIYAIVGILGYVTAR